MKYTAYLSLGAIFAGAVAVAQDFSGSGQVFIVNSTELSKASPDQIIGCLDATGAVSESNCGTFTKLNTYPNTLQSSVGNCTFTDSTQPANTDNAYGAHSYAWHCRPDYVATVSDSLYTINVGTLAVKYRTS
ncbi:uncharacterized protein F4822DRAFT_387859 [Hypoxylon trugodes]|uniref:uncharacterized protein n=1 Tax=Hypoxylon trugodes TaxID=326681 RepID=UPI0021990F1A|nr:uncharacterized protein F4822DRAFT_387859 [Hypoxylon trugodes]KAI1394301.1 hypothetical protein F4822DRAFT_387859 [Hypoxylon trugodes]